MQGLRAVSNCYTRQYSANQHIEPGRIPPVSDDAAYRVPGFVYQEGATERRRQQPAMVDFPQLEPISPIPAKYGPLRYGQRAFHDLQNNRGFWRPRGIVLRSQLREGFARF